MAPPPPARRDPWPRHLAVLTVISAAVFALWPTTQGVASWHEGQRLLVARQMLDASEWLVPRINASPYLAKPPLVYWSQMALAILRHDRVFLIDIRLSMAIWAWLGVLATYLAGRELCRFDDPPTPAHAATPPCPPTDERANAAAFWGAAILATGFEYARLARVGQIDTMLAAPAAMGVWAVARCLRHRRQTGRTAWGALAAGSLASILATLAKGPPALIAVLVAGIVGAIVMTLSRPPGTPAPDTPPPRRARARRTAGIVGAALGAIAAAVPAVIHARDNPTDPSAWIGTSLTAALGGLVALALVCVADPPRLLNVCGITWRGHALTIAAAGLAAFLAWALAVRQVVGPHLAAAWAQTEAEGNLIAFWPNAPVQNLGTLAYGVSLGTPLALLGLWRWSRTPPGARPRVSRTLAILLAWGLGGAVLFSLVGRGSSRYLLPILPAFALMGGLGAVGPSHTNRHARRLRLALALAIAALTIALTAWFALGRARLEADQSPRDFMRDLLATPGVSPERLGAFELFWAGLDYYADHLVRPIGGVPGHMTGVDPTPLSTLRRELRASGQTFTVIARLEPVDGLGPVERFGDARLSAQRIDLAHRWFIDSTEVGAFRVWFERRPRPEIPADAEGP